jgi:hypothetical protein
VKGLFEEWRCQDESSNSSYRIVYCADPDTDTEFSQYEPHAIEIGDCNEFVMFLKFDLC